MGLHFLNVDATVYLQETNPGSGKFQCLVQYKYSGIATGSGTQTLPVSGNASQKKLLPHGITLSVLVENWSLNDSQISFNLTASISGHLMGPDYLFKRTLFGGPLPKTLLPEIDDRIAAHLAGTE